jgi:myo-inositol-1(or 4)-monophosphatase
MVADTSDLKRSLDTVQTVVDEASTILMEGFRKDLNIQKKGAIDLVTEFDLRSEDLIRDRLMRAFPDDRIVGEEGAAHGEGNRVWYVDPLDGTTNFAHGHPFFCISIALYDKGEGLVAIVAAPALGTRWWAARGAGCFRNGERCTVSSTAVLDQSLCATGFPYDRRESEDDNLAEFRGFLKRSQGIRRCGSAAIDLAMIADGTFDVYWEQRLNAWDMCAGALLVLEAGGRLSDYGGGPADPRTGTLVATNGRVHSEVVRLLSRIREP